MLPRPQTPSAEPPSARLPLAAVFLLCALHIVPGLVGHDPWKPDEAYLFGVVDSLLRSGDWVVPKIAGEAFAEKPPLLYWVAALTAWLASPWLPLHDGARLASLVFVAATIGFSALGGRLLWGTGSGRIAALLATAMVGSVRIGQLMIPDLALMAAIAAGVVGLIAIDRGHRWGGWLLGTAAGAGFLAKGLYGPGVLGATAVIGFLSNASWRSRFVVTSLVLALVAALPWLVVWPSLLYQRSPEVFNEWFWQNNIGRFTGDAVAQLGADHPNGYWMKTLPWLLFPGWLYLAASWRRVLTDIGSDSATYIVAGAIVTTVAMLAAAGSARTIYALPLLPILSMLVAGYAANRSRRLDLLLLIAGVVVGLGGLVVAVGVWASLVWRGHAPDWSWLRVHLPATFELDLWRPSTFCGVLVIAVAALLIQKGRRTAQRGLWMWTVALSLTTGLIGTLWLPWLDAAKSYRATFTELGRHVPAERRCVASLGFGESERAMLAYFAHVDTVRSELRTTRDCDVLVIQSTIDAVVEGTTEPDWVRLWSGARPGDYREIFVLFVRSPRGVDVN